VPDAPSRLVHRADDVSAKASDSASASGGFTLVELLIVIIVLAILGVVVLFALSGITSKSAQAACQQDGQTVTTAITDLNNEYPGVFAAQAALGPGSAENLLMGSQYGGPYISSWPNNLPHYAYSVSTSGALLVATSPADAVTPTSPYATYSGPSSCPSTIN
jgi:prepilin-type N-terminal cleavage/methylation domain-containing protein